MVKIVLWSMFISIVATLVAMVMVCLIPKNYFVELKKRRTIKNGPVKFIRNALAVILILSGMILLVLPGPGLLVIVFGLIMMENRFKNRLLFHLLGRKAIQRSLQAIRRGFGREEFDFP